MTISQLESIALTSGLAGKYSQDLPDLEGVERNRDNRKIWKAAWRQGNLERKSTDVGEREAWYNEIEESRRRDEENGFVEPDFYTTDDQGNICGSYEGELVLARW